MGFSINRIALCCNLLFEDIGEFDIEVLPLKCGNSISYEGEIEPYKVARCVLN